MDVGKVSDSIRTAYPSRSNKNTENPETAFNEIVSDKTTENYDVTHIEARGDEVNSDMILESGTKTELYDLFGKLFMLESFTGRKLNIEL